MKNEELIERNIETLEKILEDDFLEEEYFGIEYQKHKDEITNLIKTQKSYLEKYKKDYLTYFKLHRFDYVIPGIIKWLFYALCLLIPIIYLDNCFNTMVSVFSWKYFLEIVGIFVVAPKLIFGEIIPMVSAIRVYRKCLNNLTTKLEIIKNDRIEKGLVGDKEEINKDRKINDSFVKMIKDTITKIKSLEYAEQKNDLLKIKEIAEEYFTIIRKEIELDDVVNLTTNEDIINLQKRLIEIENDAIAKAKIESDESALESEFAPLTTLDRRSVELDTGFKESYNGDVPAILKRKLNLYDD